MSIMHADTSKGMSHSHPPEAVIMRARRIRLVLTDVDGVLTSSHLGYGPNEGHWRAFSTRDGAGIQWLIHSGIPVGFISAMDGSSTRRRAADLGVQELHLGPGSKLEAMEKTRSRLDLPYDAIAYIGDDLVDLPVLRLAGLACCPMDAAAELHDLCHWVIPRRGGEGAFRCLAECVLKSQGRWEEILSAY